MRDYQARDRDRRGPFESLALDTEKRNFLGDKVGELEALGHAAENMEVSARRIQNRGNFSAFCFPTVVLWETLSCVPKCVVCIWHPGDIPEPSPSGKARRFLPLSDLDSTNTADRDHYLHCTTRMMSDSAD